MIGNTPDLLDEVQKLRCSRGFGPMAFCFYGLGQRGVCVGASLLSYGFDWSSLFDSLRAELSAKGRNEECGTCLFVHETSQAERRGRTIGTVLALPETHPSARSPLPSLQVSFLIDTELLSLLERKLLA
jgi:hypothetical protein